MQIYIWKISARFLKKGDCVICYLNHLKFPYNFNVLSYVNMRLELPLKMKMFSRMTDKCIYIYNFNGSYIFFNICNKTVSFKIEKHIFQILT